MEDPDDVVHPFAVHRVAGMRLGRDEREEVVHGGRDVHGRDLGARDHDVPRLEVPEVEHVADHLGRLVAERAALLSFVHEDLDLRFREARARGRRPVRESRDDLPEKAQRRGQWRNEQLERPE